MLILSLSPFVKNSSEEYLNMEEDGRIKEEGEFCGNLGFSRNFVWLVWVDCLTMLAMQKQDDVGSSFAKWTVKPQKFAEFPVLCTF